MTQEIKFYTVKIGKYTRNGALNVMTQFVCSSKSNDQEVRDYYLIKYKGFDINVELIQEVIDLEIKNNNQDFEIKQLKEEIHKLKTNNNKLLKAKESIRIVRDSDDFDINVKIVNKEYYEKYKELEEIKKRLEALVLDSIREEFKTVAESVRTNDIKYSHYFKSIDFTVFLDGKLIKENDIIIE